MTTNKGINIGSLFILDNVVRPPLTADQQSFLGSVAQIVMKHMEVFREARERKKDMRMSRGLNAFMEGKDHLSDEEYLPESSYVRNGEDLLKGQTNNSNSSIPGGRTRVRKQAGLKSDPNPRQFKNASNTPTPLTNGSRTGLATRPTHSHPAELLRDVKLPTDQDSSQSESDAEISKENLEVGHKTTIARAADLLCQSFDLGSGGVVVYLDTPLGFSSGAEEVPTSPTIPDTAVNVGFEDKSLTPVRRNSVFTDSTSFTHNNFDGTMEAQKNEKPANIISFSMNRPIMGFQDEAQEPASFTPLGEELLQYLLRRHPRGKLWMFNEDGSLSSEEEFSPNENVTSSHRRARMQRKQYVASMLLKHFPGGEDQCSL